MGGGVAIADFNNDGLNDLYFTGNMVADQIYVNKGSMKFENVTHSSGILPDAKWHTGVSVVDINQDGLLDIYISVSGLQADKRNLLYVNQGNMMFREQAEAYGLHDAGNTIQSTFFDFDNDGDLDLYVANYPVTSFKTPNFRYKYLMNTVTEQNSDRLYQNEGNGSFKDVTRSSGLLAFGLTISATVADFNQDGWQDIYVSNDFSCPDYFFINNGDGTFTDQLKEITKQTSFYSMGADAADINNDGLIDFFQVDMSAEDNRRAKANMASMDVSLFWSTVNNGFHYQYMYNTLQLNRGLKDGLPLMSNVAAFANVTSTDWSWAPLFADFNNDGWNDLFITNGTRREINNKDYFNALKKDLKDLTDRELFQASKDIPAEPIANYFFVNNKELGFDDKTQDWGLNQKGFSNGCAYGDLDNDGDLDLIVNNIDSSAWVYQNQINSAEVLNANYLKVKLQGMRGNKDGIGAKVVLYLTDDIVQTKQQMLSRGFQSSIDPIIHFGLGAFDKVDSIKVKWPSGLVSKMDQVKGNQMVIISEEHASTEADAVRSTAKPYFSLSDSLLDEPFRHKENRFNDYAFQVLLPHKLSTFGPALATGDVNGDGLDDFYVGGAANQTSALYLQKHDGYFHLSQFFEKSKKHEDIDALFFDADNDNDLDLYVVRGGNEFDGPSENYQDQLYLNKGDGSFEPSKVLPKNTASGSCVKACDFDQDGDIDLFVGGRLSPRNYPYPGESMLLVNRLETGQLLYDNATPDIATDLREVGMVTDAIWLDVNSDKHMDLVVVGEWMDILWMENDGSSFMPPKQLLDDSKGWWFSIEKGDFDSDGDEDLIVGNLGLNYKYKASKEEPFDVFVKDFDNNGKDDIVLSYYNFGSQFPVRGRQCSSQQIPALKSVYKDYNSFSTATVQEIFGTDALSSSLHYSISSFAHIYLENMGNEKFRRTNLPTETQLSPINDILVLDVNDDDHLDVISFGNLYASEVETPRADAGNGVLMLGDGKGSFQIMTMTESGLAINNDAKKGDVLNHAGRRVIVIANNDGPLQFFSDEQ